CVADTPLTHAHTLSLRDALPICRPRTVPRAPYGWSTTTPEGHIAEPMCGNDRRTGTVGPTRDETQPAAVVRRPSVRGGRPRWDRSEEHTSELQSRENLVCRLPLE